MLTRPNRRAKSFPCHQGSGGPPAETSRVSWSEREAGAAARGMTGRAGVPELGVSVLPERGTCWGCPHTEARHLPILETHKEEHILCECRDEIRAPRHATRSRRPEPPASRLAKHSAAGWSHSPHCRVATASTRTLPPEPSPSAQARPGPGRRPSTTPLALAPRRSLTLTPSASAAAAAAPSPEPERRGAPGPLP